MTGGTNHSQSDWAQQRERLSAYLDGEVDERERAALEQHLATCAECRQALDELRQARALLRALPTPALPRSFLLPETGAIPEPLAPRRDTPASPARTTSASSANRTGSARLLQWVGGLVATLGLFLLIGSSLVGVNYATTGAARPITSNGAQATSHPTPNQNLGVQTQGPNVATHPNTTATSGSVATPTASTTPGTTENGGENPVPVGPITGTVLLIGGAGMLVSGTVLVRRRRRTPA